MRPVQRFADQTSLNTSADTSAVNGRASSDVSSTIQSGGGINFASPLHSNKTLDSIGDGSSRYAAAEVNSNNTAGHCISSAIATSPSTTAAYVHNEGSTYYPLPASVLASGTANANGTTTVTWNGIGSAFTTGSAWVGKRFAIQSAATGIEYVRTIVSVSATNTLTVDSAIPSLSAGQNYQVWSDLGWSMTISGASDTININAAAAITVSSGTCTFNIGLSVDGGSPSQVATYTGVGSSGLPYFAVLTGLSAGTHTVTLVAYNSSSGVTVTATANALAQRVY